MSSTQASANAAHQTFLTREEVAKRLPGRPHVLAVWRACRKGVMGRNGRRVFMEHVRIGGKLLIPDSEIVEFPRRVAEADAEHFRSDVELPGARPKVRHERPRRPSRRDAEIEAAEAKLRRRT